MDPRDRAEYIKNWLSEKIADAKKATEADFSGLINHNLVREILSDLIETNSKGFRGVVATSLAGLKLDNEYNPLTEFYACNPRPIFEDVIWFVFTDNKIPCGLSDPLNVAKNVYALDNAWTTGKRPESAAKAVVKYLTLLINEKNAAQRDLLENYFYFKLVEFSKKIEDMPIASIPCKNHSRQWVASKLVEFSLSAPESGAIPQLLISSILRRIFNQGNIAVCGGSESVFGTNTTSKKPADIWLESNGSPVVLFEVTLKKVDKKRIEDCIVASDTLGSSMVPLTFICRIPADILSLDITNQLSIHYKNRTIDFVDYENFIKTSFSLINDEDSTSILNDVKEFVTLVTTSIKAKDIWNRTFY